MTNELTFDEWIENANKKAEEIIERTEEKAVKIQKMKIDCSFFIINLLFI